MKKNIFPHILRCPSFFVESADQETVKRRAREKSLNKIKVTTRILLLTVVLHKLVQKAVAIAI